MGGLSNAGFEVAPNKFILDSAPAGERVVYVGVHNSAMGAVSLFSAVFGFIVQLWGLRAGFAVCVGCQLLALALFVMMREPRVTGPGGSKPPSAPPSVAHTATGQQ